MSPHARTIAHRPATRQAGMYVVGGLYNLCDSLHSLRLQLWVGSHRYRWVKRTPALAAGLTDHVWTPTEVFTFRVPLPR